MIVEQIYTSCLSQGSYYIESNDEVAIIDPIREIDSYLEKANKRGSKIKYIFEFQPQHICKNNKSLFLHNFLKEKESLVRAAK